MVAKIDRFSTLQDIINAMMLSAFTKKAHVILVDIFARIPYDANLDGLFQSIYNSGSIVVAGTGPYC